MLLTITVPAGRARCPGAAAGVAAVNRATPARRAWSIERNLRSILREPLVEVLQPRREGTRTRHVARIITHFVEVAIELKHVSEIVGARESEAAKHRRLDLVVSNLLSQRLRHR